MLGQSKFRTANDRQRVRWMSLGASVVVVAMLCALALSGALGGVDDEAGASAPSKDAAGAHTERTAAASQLASQSLYRAGEGFRSSEERRQAILRIESLIPRPGDRTDNFDWESFAPATRGEVQAIVEYRAACAWYAALDRATHDGNTIDRDEALKVMKQIAAWPSFRGNQSGTLATQISVAARSGDVRLAKEHLQANC